MKYSGNRVSDIRIAYIGGGSRGWAWGLMSDLVSCDDISGSVALYDIDREAAEHNRIIGNRMNEAEGARSIWRYETADSLQAALTGADFVVISILPGTFDEMESDVHTPEQYGIWQPVGDSTGPGGIIRAMRTIPMFEEIATAVKTYCPDAWVINYTNPMTLCTKTLYRVFPQIKAFGCCHEVFGTQKLLLEAVKEFVDSDADSRKSIKVNPVGVNHFTWLTEATYRNQDLFPVYRKFVAKYKDSGFRQTDKNWVNSFFDSDEKVKMDLFDRFGWIAAAGDRHLAEFCPAGWYLENPDRIKQMHFTLTPVSWRKKDRKEKIEKSRRLREGTEKVEIKNTGEEGVDQIRALLGLEELITNVNIPNRGQIPNLPKGAVVETNAIFRSDEVRPVFAGKVPESIYALVSTICAEQEEVSCAISERDVKRIENAFCSDPLVTCSRADAEKLFRQMCRNTKEYLKEFSLP